MQPLIDRIHYKLLCTKHYLLILTDFFYMSQSESFVRPPSRRDRVNSCSTLYGSVDDEDNLKHPTHANQLQWTDAEEEEVRKTLDRKLLPFILLMVFVLNLDRTNLCKITNRSSSEFNYLHLLKLMLCRTILLPILDSRMTM